jgi:hypothetical protein
MAKPDLVKRAEVVRLYAEYEGNATAVARVMGLSRGTIQSHLNNAGVTAKPVAGGRANLENLQVRSLPEPGNVKRYILSSAQNNTKVHKQVLENLQALGSYYNAEIMISKFTYNKAAYGQKSVKPGMHPTKEDLASLWFDPDIEFYCQPDGNQKNVQLAPDLVWVSQANIIPTAERPLSGFESYTGTSSGIFPHVKIALQSLPSSIRNQPKLNYTTGTVTLRNYVQKKAGLKAEHHHCYGAALVEVCADGSWFVRQLNADRNGKIYDLDVCAHEGRITEGNRVGIFTPGDIHVANLNEDVADALWGKEGLLDILQPHEQHMHDIYDMRAQNHHDRGSFHKRYIRRHNAQEDICDELDATSLFLEKASRQDTKNVIIRSNHDDALERWMDNVDPRTDLINAKFWCQATLAWMQAKDEEDNGFIALEWALRKADEAELLNNTVFLARDESYIAYDIECGNHGDDGINGSRGTIMGFHKMGRKQNLGHFHQAAIVDGCYFTGKCCEPDYERGPSNHSFSHIITYENGKRAIISMRGTKWKA